MSDEASPEFTLLGSLKRVDAAEVARRYDYPADLDRCWVRANMIASLDGGATVDGRAGGLAEAGDRALFEVMREAADVVLVGAGTVRAENYSGAHLAIAARQRRQARGQAEVPPIAVVTASGALDLDSRLFTRTEVAPLIFTTTTQFPATRDRMHGRAEVIDASTSDPIVVDIGAVLTELDRRGLRRVLCEGGPSTLAHLVAEDLLDELALTVAPILVSGSAPRVVTGHMAANARLRPADMLTDDEGYLYLRYSRGL